MDNIFSVDLLNWGMNKSLVTHTVARANVANANVPDFNALKVNFSEQLNTLKTSALSDMTQLDIVNTSLDEMYQSNVSSSFTTGVQLEQEVAEMVKAAGKYQTMADLTSRQFGLMKLAIGGR